MIKLVAVAHLNQTAEIHSADSLGDVLYRAKVMSDKEVRDISLSLNLFEKVDDLRLDGNVERRNRFVADDEAWVESESSCDGDSLTLTAREFVRITSDVVRLKPDDLQKLTCFFLFFLV